VVERFGALVHLQVADHVADDEADQDDAGDGHRDLLADRRPQRENTRRMLTPPVVVS
jgi:hypothetical protein